MKTKKIRTTATRLLHKFSAPLAAVALFTAMVSVNTACSWLGHQPEIPQKANRLKKF